MTSTNISPLDKSLQKAHEWLKEVQKELGLADQQSAYVTLRGVLHALRDRISVEQSAQLSSQLPLALIGIYYHGWKPANQPLKIRRREDFLDHLRDYLTHDSDPVKAFGSVLKVMIRHMSSGELESIRTTLPKEVLQLWPNMD